MSKLIQKAQELLQKVGDEVGIPSASEFTTEAAADSALGPKLAELEEKYRVACGKNGLTTNGDCWQQCAPTYLATKGWRATLEDGGLVVHTGDVEK
ncbi:MAG: hypothetical protein K2W82_15635 [Candidatus Obscuribacterales bacterium]|nr:hypothetical protein [Candidatus Obscuribacterales bacterium]